MGSLCEDLRSPDAFASPLPHAIALIETHLSWVYLLEHDVFKIKKPVDFGFVDFRELSERRRACEAEVTLNLRLAPDVYRGLVPVYRDAKGQHRWYGEGEPVEWAVHMIRLSDAHRADVRLARGELGFPHIDQIASRLAAFHQEARCDQETSAFGAYDVIAHNAYENFLQIHPLLSSPADLVQLEANKAWQLAFLQTHRPTIEQRCATQRSRDGHGDLRLEHIYFRDGAISVIDCIEFSDRFRYGDVSSDIGFLAMDLHFAGQAPLAERLLARYARDANDYGLYAMVDFYVRYRATVRAKVNLLLAADAAAPASTRAEANQRAHRFLELAHPSSPPPVQRPLLVLVGGVIAAGKSTVAEQLANQLAAPVVEADRTRKFLVGVSPETSAGDEPWQGAYDAAMSHQVYDELLRRAALVLASGRSVVVDASFRSRAHRQQFRDWAAQQEVPFLFVECWVPRDVSEQRLQARAQQPGVSDARADLLDSFLASYEAVDELEPPEFVRIDTRESQTLATLQAFLTS